MKHIKPHIILILLLSISTLTSCKSGKKALSDIEKQALTRLLEQTEYKVDINTAYPFQTAATQQVMNAILTPNTGNNSARVNVSASGNFIEIQKDSAKGYLSFFGERRNNSGSYGGRNLAIEFDGLMTDVEKTINDNTGKLELKFTIPHVEGDNDTYIVRLTMFPNNNVIVNVTPTFRTFMRYDGVLVEMDDKDKE